MCKKKEKMENVNTEEGRKADDGGREQMDSGQGEERQNKRRVAACWCNLKYIHMNGREKADL